MKRDEAEKLSKVLTDAIRGMVDDDGRRAGTTPLHGRPLDDDGAVQLRKGHNPKEPAKGNGADQGPLDIRKLIEPEVLEAIFRAFKNRMIDELRVDPILLQLIAQQVEMIVEIQPQLVTLEGGTLKGRVALLIARGWFDDQRATSAVRRQLASTGADPGGGGSLSDKLAELTREGFLERVGEGQYRKAAGIKITEKRLEA
jgi:hypothetical protein